MIKTRKNHLVMLSICLWIKRESVCFEAKGGKYHDFKMIEQTGILKLSKNELAVPLDNEQINGHYNHSTKSYLLLIIGKNKCLFIKQFEANIMISKEFF